MWDLSDLSKIFAFGISTFLIGFIIMPYFIKYLKILHFGKQIREEALIGKATEFFRLHKVKEGTPTMGGTIVLFMVALMVLISLLLQKMGYINNSLWERRETYLPIFTLFSVGAIGLLDDYLNIKGYGKKGISAYMKLILLTLFAFLGSRWFYFKLGFNGISLPFGWEINLGLLFIPLFIFIIIASANSVNLTDGLDGLAGGLLLFCYSVYAFITFHKGMNLLCALCLVIIGALLAFLWFNVKPAKVFMGDVGSLALGANLGVIAVLTDTIVIFLIIMSIFIFETISVIIQITSKKLRNGKKIFKIAPFHHHLEAIGRNEETIVFRFWLIGAICAVSGLIVYLL